MLDMGDELPVGETTDHISAQLCTEFEPVYLLVFRLFWREKRVGCSEWKVVEIMSETRSMRRKRRSQGSERWVVICSPNLYLIILSVTVCLTPTIGPFYPDSFQRAWSNSVGTAISLSSISRRRKKAVRSRWRRGLE